MYMKQDLSDEVIVNSDLDTFRQDEAEKMELYCEPDTCGDCVSLEQPKTRCESKDRCGSGRLLPYQGRTEKE